MTKRDPSAEALERLKAVRRDPSSAAAIEEVRLGLKSKYNFVAAAAAAIVGESMLATLVPELEEAFERLLVDPVKSDRACLAKTAIVEAIGKLSGGGETTLLKAVRCFQPEPAYDRPIDTAISLRATAAIALAERSHPKALDVAVELLVDKEANARLGALRALETLPSEGAKALLKYKLLIRDAEREVVAENLRALLTVQPDEMSFGRELMADYDERLACMAALAVGESRAPGALEALTEAYNERLGPEFRASVLLALALLKDERCIDLLCDVLRGGDRRMALGALEAGLPFAGRPALREQMAAAVQASRDRELQSRFDELYGRD